MITMRERINILVTIYACIFFLFVNIINDKQLLVSIIPNFIQNPTDIETRLKEVETSFQNNFVGKDVYCDVCGLYQKVLSRQIIGNFEYIIDKNEVVHAVRENEYGIDCLISNITSVSNLSKKNGCDFLYVQGPNRELDDLENDEAAMFNIDNLTMDTIIERLHKQNIEVLDERQSFLEEDTGIESKDIFFHTDLHMETDAEICASKFIGSYLINEYNVPLNNLEYLSDKHRYYTVSEYAFLGNYGRSIGKYCIPIDCFKIYEPIFPTDYELNIWSSDETRKGSFKEVLINGYENTDNDEYTYWITDFLCYGQPYYTIKNNKQSKGDILIITDSIGYRTISYLSLCCHEITILDPRFFNGTNYIEKAFQDRQYDIVLVYQGTFLADHSWCIE